MILETERLILREMGEQDIRDLKEILQNPRVMYAYEHDFTDRDVREWLTRQQKRYREYGFGLWAMILKSTGEMIGQAGLTMQPYREKQVLEIGYLLKESFWHCGYAREAAAGCKQYAFEVLKRFIPSSNRIISPLSGLQKASAWRKKIPLSPNTITEICSMTCTRCIDDPYFILQPSVRTQCCLKQMPLSVR